MLLAGATALSGAAQSKFDAAGMMVMHTYAARLQNPTAELPQLDIPGADIALSGRADDRATLIVSLNEGATASDLEVRGFDILTDLGDILIVSGTMADIQDLESCDFVKAMSFGQKLKPALKEARSSISGDAVHSGTDLSKAFKGNGVIAGIFDTGVDPNHANFLGADDKTRIAKLWYYARPGMATTYTADNMESFTTDVRTETHGTHTLGCLAGSFNKPGGKVVTVNTIGSKATVSTDLNNPYYGMAPEAEIVVGCGILYNQSITDAASKVAEYVRSRNMPAVFNLSLGGSTGSHDEFDLTNQALDKLGKDMIICIASGNEADYAMSIDKTLTADQTEFSTLFGSDESYNTNATGYVDIWSDSATPFTVTAILYDRNTAKAVFEQPIGGGDEKTASFAYSKTDELKKAYSSGSVTMTSSKNTGTSNRYNVLISVNRLVYNTSTNSGRNYMLGFKISGTAGQRIMITTNSENAEFTASRAPGFEEGSGVFSINSMACGKNVISIGAYTTKTKWGVLGVGQTGDVYGYGSGMGYTRNKIAPFSSYGTLADGRQLPDVCAPGAAIVSSISNYYVTSGGATARAMAAASQPYNGRDNYWGSEQGTSMACPIAAGTIALWLEANPNLTVEDVRTIIRNTSKKDTYVTSHEEPVQWGAGKINALDGIKEAIRLAAGVNDVTIDGKDKLVLTPAGNNTWEIYMPYASAINAEVYNLAGLRMASANADGDTLTFTADGLEKGIYLISVNGTEARRILVR